MKIERVKIEDAEELLAIYAPYVKGTAISFEYEVPGLEEFETRIKTISSKYPYIKAVDETGAIIGYAYATAFKTRRAYDWAVETTIYIKEDKRKSGVGSKLYGALEKALKEMGVLNMNACIAYTDHEDENLTNGSMKFHEKQGYTLVGTFHKCGYKFNKWYDMIWMEKEIGTHGENQSPVKFGEWTV